MVFIRIIIGFGWFRSVKFALVTVRKCTLGTNASKRNGKFNNGVFVFYCVIFDGIIDERMQFFDVTNLSKGTTIWIINAKNNNSIENDDKI